jgi:hypothetical protein
VTTAAVVTTLMPMPHSRPDRPRAYRNAATARTTEIVMSKSLHHQIASYARSLISQPERWIQGDYAQFKDGRTAEPEYPKAYRFCAVGALHRAAHQLCADPNQLIDVLAGNVQQGIDRFGKLARRHYENLEAFNDSPYTGHAAVLKLFDDYLAAQ